MTEELTSLVSSTSLEHRLDDTFKCLASMNGVSINVVSTIASFLQMHMGRVNASATLFGAKIPYSCDFTNNLFSHVDVFKLGYVSLEVAIEMASKAQLENVNILLQETKDFSQLQNKTFIGIGCTAAIRSEKPKKGPHRAFVSLKIGTKIFVLHLDMKKEFRDRDQEDVVASYVMVISLQRALGIPELPIELFLHPEEKIELVAETEDDPLNGLFLEGSTVESVLFTGTVKPGVFHNVSLPSGTLVYSGSYNPIHEGHVRLALAAQEKNIQTYNLRYNTNKNIEVFCKALQTYSLYFQYIIAGIFGLNVNSLPNFVTVQNFLNTQKKQFPIENGKFMQVVVDYTNYYNSVITPVTYDNINNTIVYYPEKSIKLINEVSDYVTRFKYLNFIMKMTTGYKDASNTSNTLSSLYPQPGDYGVLAFEDNNLDYYGQFFVTATMLH